MQECIQLLGLHHHNGFICVDQAFIDHIAGNFQGRLCRPLAVSCLQHEELSVFDGELHVLHVLVMVFQSGADIHELFIGGGRYFFQLVDFLRSTNTGNNVFTLCVHKELAIELVFAGGWIPGECHTCAAVFSHIAENHHLYVDSCTPVGGNVILATVVDRSFVVPGTEHSFDGFHHLGSGVCREIFSQFCTIEFLEPGNQFLHVFCIQFQIILFALFGFYFINDFFKALFGKAFDNIGKHLDKPAVAVIGKAFIAGFFGDGGSHYIIDAQIQNGIHHARHGSAGSGSYRNKQRVFPVAEFLSGFFFQHAQVFFNLSPDLIADLFPVFVVFVAGFCCNGEAIGHRHAQTAHFSKVCTLSSKQLTHIGVAFVEQIYIFLVHQVSSLNSVRNHVIGYILEIIAHGKSYAYPGSV